MNWGDPSFQRKREIVSSHKKNVQIPSQNRNGLYPERNEPIEYFSLV